jgi:hypothetical protein
MNVMCVLINEIPEFIKILVSVLFGMFGKHLYDVIKDKIELSKEKKFILKYLRESKAYLPNIKDEYINVRKVIEQGGEGVFEVKLFEGFDTHVLKSFSFPRYFEMFKENAFILFSIYNMVEKLKGNLPIDIYNDYRLKTLDYNREVIKSDNDLYKSLLVQQKKIAIQTCDLKAGEIDKIKEKINSLLNIK